MSLFEARASWPFLPMEAPTAFKMEKAEEKILSTVPAIPNTMVNKPPQGKAEEMYEWGPHCPICAKSTPTLKLRAQMTSKTTCKETIIPKALP